MNFSKIFTVAIFSSTLLFAQGQNKDEMNTIVKEGSQAAKALLMTLQNKMKANMKEGGVMGAFTFCSNEAQTLTAAVNEKLPQNVTVKRISLKYRNSADAPQADEQAVLESFQELQDTKKMLPKYLVKKVDAHTYKFYKPLLIGKPVCLMCHGDLKNAPKLKEAIDSKYPNDTAVGYKMGDLRGAVVVTIKK